MDKSWDDVRKQVEGLNLNKRTDKYNRKDSKAGLSFLRRN